MPVARPDVAPEEIRQPRELNRFPNCDAADNSEHTENRKDEIRSALERVVFALLGMTLFNEEVVTHHCPRVARKRFSRNHVSPFPVEIDESEIDEPVDDEHPHHREVPVARAREPAAEREHAWDCLMLERITTEGLAVPRACR